MSFSSAFHKLPNGVRQLIEIALARPSAKFHRLSLTSAQDMLFSLTSEIAPVQTKRPDPVKECYEMLADVAECVWLAKAHFVTQLPALYSIERARRQAMLHQI